MILDKAWFLLFFSPTCGHCKKFRPIYDEFFYLHKGEINIGSIDCKDEKSGPLCLLYEVRSYPSLKVIAKDESGHTKVYTFSESKKLKALEKFAL